MKGFRFIFSKPKSIAFRRLKFPRSIEEGKALLRTDTDPSDERLDAVVQFSRHVVQVIVGIRQ